MRGDDDGDRLGRQGPVPLHRQPLEALHGRPRARGRRRGQARRRDPGRPPDARPHPRLHDLDLAASTTAARTTTSSSSAAPTSTPATGWSDNKDYPEIADDFARTFEVLKALPCDVFLGAHGGYYGMVEKYERAEAEAREPVRRPRGLPDVRRAEGGGISQDPGRSEGEAGPGPRPLKIGDPRRASRPRRGPRSGPGRRHPGRPVNRRSQAGKPDLRFRPTRPCTIQA